MTGRRSIPAFHMYCITILPYCIVSSILLIPKLCQLENLRSGLYLVDKTGAPQKLCRGRKSTVAICTVSQYDSIAS